jgi:hypothetical protein
VPKKNWAGLVNCALLAVLVGTAIGSMFVHTPIWTTWADFNCIFYPVARGQATRCVDMRYHNPIFFTWLLRPFGALPLIPSYYAFMAAGLVPLLYLSRATRRGWWWAASFPCFAMLICGQVDALLAASLLALMGLGARRPFASGVLAVLCMVKFHIYLLPVAWAIYYFGLWRSWRFWLPVIAVGALGGFALPSAIAADVEGLTALWAWWRLLALPLLLLRPVRGSPWGVLAVAGIVNPHGLWYTVLPVAVVGPWWLCLLSWASLVNPGAWVLVPGLYLAYILLQSMKRRAATQPLSDVAAVSHHTTKEQGEQ